MTIFNHLGFGGLECLFRSRSPSTIQWRKWVARDQRTNDASGNGGCDILSGGTNSTGDLGRTATKAARTAKAIRIHVLEQSGALTNDFRPPFWHRSVDLFGKICVAAFFVVWYMVPGPPGTPGYMFVTFVDLGGCCCCRCCSAAISHNCSSKVILAAEHAAYQGSREVLGVLQGQDGNEAWNSLFKWFLILWRKTHFHVATFPKCGH